MSENVVTLDDGHELFYRVWRPQNRPRAALMVSHGYAEHSGRYGNVGTALTAAGYVVYAHDQRGHGKSKGMRAHVESRQHLLDDLVSLLSLVREKEGDNIPVFLLGHSFGSVISVHFAAEYQDELKGLILSGAGIRYGDLSNSQLRQIKVAWRLAPKKVMTSEFDPSRLSHDQDVISAYKSDPLVFAGSASLGLLRAMTGLMESIRKKAATLRIPVLIQKGGGDVVVLGERELHDSMTSTQDKTLKVYEGLFHEIYNETADRRKEVLDDLVAWLDKHL
ncbi:MAG: lysophospholipase [Candidatus Thorarchaeota archaeon]|nr:lysophospholipase [Candidatus Thorarchaeota archaeon]